MFKNLNTCFFKLKIENNNNNNNFVFNFIFYIKMKIYLQANKFSYMNKFI